MPYKYGKHGSIPPLRYIDEPVQLPEPLTIEQANRNIAYISNLKAQGLVDLDFANSLIADNTTIANNLIAEEELKFKINPPETRDVQIRIEGGLSNGQVNLPGTDIIQPDVLLSSRPINGHALAAPESVIQHSATEDPPIAPAQLKAQGPHPLQEHHFKDSGQNPSTGNGQET